MLESVIQTKLPHGAKGGGGEVGKRDPQKRGNVAPPALSREDQRWRGHPFTGREEDVAWRRRES